MRKVIISLLLIQCLFPSYSFSQSFRYGLVVGYQSYKMDDLHYINDLINKSLPFESLYIEKYPAFLNYGTHLMYSFNEKFGLGLNYKFRSTGSRISRSDFSGEYLFDTKINSHSPGIVFDLLILEYKQISLNVLNEVGITYSRLNISEKFWVDDIYDSQQTYDYKSKNIFIEPAIAISYPISLLRFGMSLGYHVDVNKGELYLDTNPSIKLQKITSNAVANWSGINFSLYMQISLGKKL